MQPVRLQAEEGIAEQAPTCPDSLPPAPPHSRLLHCQLQLHLHSCMEFATGQLAAALHPCQRFNSREKLSACMQRMQ